MARESLTPRDLEDLNKVVEGLNKINPDVPYRGFSSVAVAIANLKGTTQRGIELLRIHQGNDGIDLRI